MATPQDLGLFRDPTAAEQAILNRDALEKAKAFAAETRKEMKLGSMGQSIKEVEQARTSVANGTAQAAKTNCISKMCSNAKAQAAAIGSSLRHPASSVKSNFCDGKGVTFAKTARVTGAVVGGTVAAKGLREALGKVDERDGQTHRLRGAVKAAGGTALAAVSLLAGAKGKTGGRSI